MPHPEPDSPIEALTAPPTADARVAQQIRDPAPPDPTRPSEPSGPWPLPSPVDWHDLHGPDADTMLAMLADFLEWAVPRWGFNTDQFPHACWWQHPDIVEEMTAWWGMWIVYIHNPDAHPADPTAFHERTWNLKQRLNATYRGRCRHGHEEQSSDGRVKLPPSKQATTVFLAPAMPPVPEIARLCSAAVLPRSD